MVGKGRWRRPTTRLGRGCVLTESSCVRHSDIATLLLLQVARYFLPRWVPRAVIFQFGSDLTLPNCLKPLPIVAYPVRAEGRVW